MAAPLFLTTDSIKNFIQAVDILGLTHYDYYDKPRQHEQGIKARQPPFKEAKWSDTYLHAHIHCSSWVVFFEFEIPYIVNSGEAI